MSDSKTIVERGWDVIAERYAHWSQHVFLTTLGARDSPDHVQGDFLGAPMFFSSFDADTNRDLLRIAGFELVEDEVITQDEGEEGKATFLWILARKPARVDAAGAG